MLENEDDRLPKFRHDAFHSKLATGNNETALLKRRWMHPRLLVGQSRILLQHAGMTVTVETVCVQSCMLRKLGMTNGCLIVCHITMLFAPEALKSTRNSFTVHVHVHEALPVPSKVPCFAGFPFLAVAAAVPIWRGKSANPDLHI